jgi:hypothetical protein
VTYGVDLDGGPDRPIHGLGHGVRPLPNFRPGDIALFESLGWYPMQRATPEWRPAGGLLDQLRRAWWPARPTPLVRSVVPFPGRISCETLATKGADARSLNLLRF